MADEYAFALLKPKIKITLAQFGTSNVGRFKTLYREGLKNRYGALMQTISGVHYNFFVTYRNSRLEAWANITDEETGKEGDFRRLFTFDP